MARRALLLIGAILLFAGVVVFSGWMSLSVNAELPLALTPVVSPEIEEEVESDPIPFNLVTISGFSCPDDNHWEEAMVCMPSVASTRQGHVTLNDPCSDVPRSLILKLYGDVLIEQSVRDQSGSLLKRVRYVGVMAFDEEYNLYVIELDGRYDYSSDGNVYGVADAVVYQVGSSLVRTISLTSTQGRERIFDSSSSCTEVEK